MYVEGRTRAEDRHGNKAVGMWGKAGGDELALGRTVGVDIVCVQSGLFRTGAG